MDKRSTNHPPAHQDRTPQRLKIETEFALDRARKAIAAQQNELLIAARKARLAL